MNHRQWATGAVVGVLALATTLLVVLALRPAESANAPVAPFEVGAVAAVDGTVWRWIGPSDCNADADVVQLERSEDGGEWQPVPIPLANIYSISFANETRGVATGTTAQCSRGVAITRDGGRTWRYRQDNPVLLDAWYQGDLVWGVERVIGQPQTSVYKVDAKMRLRPVGGLDPAEPCQAADGVPDHIAFWTDTTGLLLCQNTVVGTRLLARTTDGGTNFERLTDDRPESGLDGAETILDIDTVGTETVFVLFGPGECNEGQLRVSDSQGAAFDRLACPSESLEVDNVLDVAFTSEQDGVLVGLRNRAPITLVTADGGVTWTER